MNIHIEDKNNDLLMLIYSSNYKTQLHQKYCSDISLLFRFAS